MNDNVGMLLEGGAMRSVFTAGILDYFLEKNVVIPNVMAVSAGAYAGMNYVSEQKGRVMEAIVKPMEEKKLFGLGVFLRTGAFFDMDRLFYEVPYKESPFDFDTFTHSRKRFITSTINCDTGENIYYDHFSDLDEFLHITKAANSLPLIAKVEHINGVPMLDGGMKDALPIERILEEGWQKIIVIFTRDVSYRKTPNGDVYNNWFTKLAYRKYKGLVRSIGERPDKYNNSIDTIARLEQEGRAFVFRPKDITLTNNESDPDVLRQYYSKGYEQARNRYQELLDFLN